MVEGNEYADLDIDEIMYKRECKIMYKSVLIDVCES